MENASEIKKEMGPMRINREIIREPEYMITWGLNTLCNFRCEYCFCNDEVRSKEHPDTGRYSPQHIAKCFDDTGKIWRVHLSGGESFLYPRFVELVEVLTKTHYVSINTNLSTSNVHDLANVIQPEKILYIHAALHIMERERRKDGIKNFVDKCLYLQEKGFYIILEYVAYPPLLSRIAKDLDYFRSQGIRHFNIKIFRGKYYGKLYPESYTNYEKNLIVNSDSSIFEKNILQKEFNFFGKLCFAGQKYFSMDPAGNLTRCGFLRNKYGNFFTGKYHFDESPKPCPLKKCRCPYEGMRLAQTQKGSAILTLNEMVLEGVHFKKKILELLFRKLLFRRNI